METDALANALTAEGYQRRPSFDATLLERTLDENRQLRKTNEILERRLRVMTQELHDLRVQGSADCSGMSSLLTQIAEKTGVTGAALKGSGRTQDLARPRWEFCYRAYYELGKSLPQIGRFLGGRHHTSVLHSRRKYEEWLLSQEEAQNAVD